MPSMWREEVEMSIKQRIAGIAVFIGELTFILGSAYLVVRYYL